MGGTVLKIENDEEEIRGVLFSEMPAEIAKSFKKEVRSKSKSKNRFKERLRFFLRKIRLR